MTESVGLISTNGISRGSNNDAIRDARANAATEGFHNKMERISRVAYGFRNFRNYRLRVLMQCA